VGPSEPGRFSLSSPSQQHDRRSSSSTWQWNNSPPGVAIGKNKPMLRMIVMSRLNALQYEGQ
jgi:hypothetical protein